MNAIVTGAAGFAGRHLVHHLLDSGDAVFALCHNLGALQEDSYPVEAWDISRPASVALVDKLQAFEPQVIYHLAAISHPGSCGNDLPNETCAAVNILGTRNVADLALLLPSKPKILFVSSSKVYGARSSDNPTACESDAPHPIGGYAHSKWAAEEILNQRSGEGLQVIIARAFNHTGPNQSANYLVPEWFQKVANGNDPVQVRSLETWLDLSDVRDVVAIYRKLAQDGCVGEPYNVGSGQAISTEQIFQSICRVLNTSPNVFAEKQGISQQPIANISKLEAAIGKFPNRPLVDTLRDVGLSYGFPVDNFPASDTD